MKKFIAGIVIASSITAVATAQIVGQSKEAPKSETVDKDIYTLQVGDDIWLLSREESHNHDAKQLSATPIKAGKAAQIAFVDGKPELVAQPVPTKTAKEVHTNISSYMSLARPGVEVGDVYPSPIPGLFKARIQNGPDVYAAADGQHFVSGELFEVGAQGIVNVTRREMNSVRGKLLADVDVNEMIVFAPEETKAVISVYTDVDCGYCQKLHQEVPELNAMGIEVRYMAFPRMGLGSDSYRKIASAWCANDPRDALTRLKAREPIPDNVCDGNPVSRQYQLGQDMGISGTPAIILADGELIPGYVPASELASRLGL